MLPPELKEIFPVGSKLLWRVGLDEGGKYAMVSVISDYYELMPGEYESTAVEVE